MRHDCLSAVLFIYYLAKALEDPQPGRNYSMPKDLDLIPDMGKDHNYYTRGGHSVRFHTGVCSSGVRTLTLFLGKPDSENIPYFREIPQSPAPEAVRTPKTYPILGKFDKITPYFREIW